jgi:hypothetical protein
MIRVISQFHHVVALLIAEHLECVFKREGSGSAKAGADDFECHVVSLRCVRSNSLLGLNYITKSVSAQSTEMLKRRMPPRINGVQK